MFEEKCFAEIVTGKCVILTCRKCQGHEKCSMYKTKEQAKADRQKAFERIASLPLEQQHGIADAYYGGIMPWYVKG
jgi:hypothetical protein